MDNKKKIDKNRGELLFQIAAAAGHIHLISHPLLQPQGMCHQRTQNRNEGVHDKAKRKP